MPSNQSSNTRVNLDIPVNVPGCVTSGLTLPALPDDSDLIEETVSSKTVYQGRIVTVRYDEAELPDGKVRSRDVVMHPGGAVVLPVLDVGTPDERIVFVQQYRYPLGRSLLELPAGKLDPPETPDDAVRRELAEETGYEAEHWTRMSAIYPTPGFCDETLWLYKATGLRQVDYVATFDDEEHIQLVELTVSQAWQMIQQQVIVDAKTICLLALTYPNPWV